MNTIRTSLIKATPYFAQGALAGAFISIAYQPFGTSWIALVSLIPLIAALFRAQRPFEGWAAMAGFYLPLTFVCSETLWQDAALEQLGMVFGHALLYAPVGWWVVALGLKREIWFKATVLISLWLGVEAIFGHFALWGVFASPIALGYAIAESPLVSLARISGVGTLSFWLIAVNLTVYLMWKKSIRSAIVLGTVTAGLLSFTLWSPISTKQVRPSLRVTAIQGNVSGSDKILERFDVRMAHDNFQRHRLLSRSAVTDKPDLLLWSEVAYPGKVNALEKTALFKNTLVGLPPLLFGAVLEENGSFSNAAVYWNGFHANTVYVKRAPVPEFEAWATPGKTATTLEVNEVHVGVLICSDSIYSDLVRDTVNAGAEVLVVLANTNSGGNVMHLRHSIVRAAENGRALVQASQRTASAFVGADGTLQKSSHVGNVGWLTGNLQPSNLKTSYTQFGHWLGWVWLLVFASIAIGRHKFPQTISLVPHKSIWQSSWYLNGTQIAMALMIAVLPTLFRMPPNSGGNAIYRLKQSYMLGWESTPNFALPHEARRIVKALQFRHKESRVFDCRLVQWQEISMLFEWCGFSGVVVQNTSQKTDEFAFSVVQIDERFVVPLAVADDYTYALDPTLGFIVFPSSLLSSQTTQSILHLSI
jgi:apolipoprotein N-acyltransferase